MRHQYGGEAVTRARRNRDRLNNVMRTTLEYRTVALDAAVLLARIPPLQFMVGMRRRVFLRIRDLKGRGEYDSKEEGNIRNEETLLMYRQWRIYLQRSGISGRRVVEAIIPYFQRWVERKHGNLEFRMVQLLTGHGSFGGLFVGYRGDTEECPHCEEGRVDSVDHTIQECTAWSQERGELTRTLGVDLSMKGIVEGILESREKWKAFSLRGKGDASEGVGAGKGEGGERQMREIGCGASGP